MNPSEGMGISAGERSSDFTKRIIFKILKGFRVPTHLITTVNTSSPNKVTVLGTKG